MTEPVPYEPMDETEAAYEERMQRERARHAAAPTPSSQVEYPWRAAARTGVQVIVSLALLWPLVQPAVDELLAALALPGPVAAWVAGAITVVGAVSTFIARLSALPAVDTFVQRFMPWLAPTPKP